ncbi:hypothetical protein T12_15667 [Trichinella patagoniensis]|uniref:Uncharacterized protein n=1 Tax=Trichinella patagoniensis TaxID=990121 RepID=A0A0V0Z118_9BILA|nr:hypothetical protein T12_15667 [Trichinella patagoniensis]
MPKAFYLHLVPYFCNPALLICSTILHSAERSASYLPLPLRCRTSIHLPLRLTYTYLSLLTFPFHSPYVTFSTYLQSIYLYAITLHSLRLYLPAVHLPVRNHFTFASTLLTCSPFTCTQSLYIRFDSTYLQSIYLYAITLYPLRLYLPAVHLPVRNHFISASTLLTCSPFTCTQSLYIRFDSTYLHSTCLCAVTLSTYYDATYHYFTLSNLYCS